MSKLGKLKKEAYQAGKKRNWPEAIAIYERILEIDKSNPTLINELGDVCLKNREAARAIAHFLNAAAKYRQTGLLNNAVAIYKKILRHDAKSLNAHWYLAEIRASQGLLVEGQVHALEFLNASDTVQPDMHDVFHKRCQKLLGLFPDSSEVLDRLATVFQVNGLALEQKRVDVLRACTAFDAGHEAEARAQVEQLVTEFPELQNYSEFGQWQQRVGGEYVGSHGHDVNAIDLEGAAGVAVGGGDALEDVDEETESTADTESADDRVDRLAERVSDGGSDLSDPAANFGDVALSSDDADDEAATDGAPRGEEPLADARDSEATTAITADEQSCESPSRFGEVQLDHEAMASGPVAESAAGTEVDGDEEPDSQPYADETFARDSESSDDDESASDEDGCINIDVDFGASLDDLARAAAEAAQLVGEASDEEAAGESDAFDIDAEADSLAGDPVRRSADEGASPDAAGAHEHIDLLAEILADDRAAEQAAQNREVDTITDEIGHKVCPDAEADDPGSLYSKGMVYLEMGLFEQACDCFERASEAPEEALRSLEMWGIALVRSGSIAEAIKVLEGALEVPVAKAADQLGLLYQLGRAHETADHEEEARDYFERVQAVDPSFLDVGQRLATLATT